MKHSILMTGLLSAGLLIALGGVPTYAADKASSREEKKLAAQKGEKQELAREKELRELKRELEELHAELKELKSGRHREEAERERRHERPGMEREREHHREEAQRAHRHHREHMEKERGQAEPRPGHFAPKAIEGHKKLHHLMAAIHNLHAAGMHELAEELERKADGMRREMASHFRGKLRERLEERGFAPHRKHEMERKGPPRHRDDDEEYHDRRRHHHREQHGAGALDERLDQMQKAIKELGQGLHELHHRVAELARERRR